MSILRILKMCSTVLDGTDEAKKLIASAKESKASIQKMKRAWEEVEEIRKEALEKEQEG